MRISAKACLLSIATAAASTHAMVGSAAADSEHRQWGGLYIGAGVGGASTKINHSDSDDRVTTIFSTQDGGQRGFGTVVAGYDHQFGSHLVAGVFADYDFGGASGTWNDIRAGNFIRGSFNQSSTWSIGGRLGIPCLSP